MDLSSGSIKVFTHEDTELRLQNNLDAISSLFDENERLIGDKISDKHIKTYMLGRKYLDYAFASLQFKKKGFSRKYFAKFWEIYPFRSSKLVSAVKYMILYIKYL